MKMIRFRTRWVAVAAALMMLLSFAAACAKDPPAPEQTTKESYVVGVSMDTMFSSYWGSAVTSLDATAKEMGNVELRYLVAEGDANVQNEQIDSLIAQDVDAIICVPKDGQAIMAAVAKCNAANIPFIFLDRPVESTSSIKVDYGVATENYEIVVISMNMMVDYAKANNFKLKALELMGALTDNNAIVRSQAYADVSAANPDVFEILQTIPTDWDANIAYSGLQNAFAANPDANCVLVPSDHFWPAIENVLTEIGRLTTFGEEGHVYIVAVGIEPYVLPAVRDSYIGFDSSSPIKEAAKLTLEAAVKLANGESMGKDFTLLAGFVLTPQNFNELASQTYGYDEWKAG